MKCLTIRQPWLRAITHGDKRTENRRRRPPEKMIGQRIGLHAARLLDPPVNWRGQQGMNQIYKAGKDELHMGCIVATAVLVGYVVYCGRGAFDIHHAPKHYWPLEDRWLVRQAGNVGWLLDDVQLLPEPIPARGQLWFWEHPIEVSYG